LLRALHDPAFHAAVSGPLEPLVAEALRVEAEPPRVPDDDGGP
jgi:hypothetical protein